MKVLLLSARPLGAAEIDRVLLSGLHPSAVDVCPSADVALSRVDTFPPDLIVVNLPEPLASDAVRRLREHGLQTPTLIVAAGAVGELPAAGGVLASVEQHANGTAAESSDLDVLTHERPAATEDLPPRLI